MHEVTRIITARITFIDREDKFRGKYEDGEIVKEAITELLGTDDVVIDNVQDFIRDECV
jgi:hypothetical protein